MVIYVEYHIPKEVFVKNRKAFRKILYKKAYDIAEMKFVKGMGYEEIVKHFDNEHSVYWIRKILSYACMKIREGGYIK